MRNVTFLSELATSSLNRSTSSGVIHRDDVDIQSSIRDDPARNVLSTSLSELFPSIVASIENFIAGSPSSLYMQGGHIWCDFQFSSLPSACCSCSSTAQMMSR